MEQYDWLQNGLFAYHDLQYGQDFLDGDLQAPGGALCIIFKDHVRS